MIGYTWSPTSSISTLDYFLDDAAKHKEVLHQLELVGAFRQSNVKHRVFVKLDIRYGEYFPEYANYFGRPLILKNAIYGMNNKGESFTYKLTNCMIDEAGFIQSKFQSSVYYKYAPYGSKLVVISYDDDCESWYTSE